MRKFLLIALCCTGPLLYAQGGVTAFTGAHIIPVSGPEIDEGVLLVDGETIRAVGAKADVKIPDGATVVDLQGKVIMPGLVDTHSHLGEVNGGDGSGALHPSVRAMDGIDPGSDGFMRALSGGITTLNVMPGSGHLMSGQTIYLKLREGHTLEDITFCKDTPPEQCGGMKMANGTNSIRDNKGGFPGTRARSAAMVRELFTSAQAYAAKKKTADPPPLDLGKEALIEIMEGRRIVHFHTHRSDDILTALRLGKEFGFVPVLHHVSEGWKVATEIAEAGAPCSIILIDSPGGKPEAVNLVPETGAVLEKAGADVAFHTDDGITDSRLFIRSAAFAHRDGMSRAKALEGLTLAGARMLGLQGRVGSLEAGKDADFIVLSGDPFSVYTQIEQTWVEGQKRFDISRAEDKKYLTGGYEVYRSNHNMHVHE